MKLTKMPSRNTSDEVLVLALSIGRSGVSSDALYPPTTTAVVTRGTLASEPMHHLSSPVMAIETTSLRYATSALSGIAIPGPSTPRNAPYASAIPPVHEASMSNSSSSIDLLVMQSPIYQSHFRSARAPPPDSPVCIGHGLDAPAIGVLSTLVLPTVFGLFIWVSLLSGLSRSVYQPLSKLLFAILRPRYRQVYGLREWFPPQGCVVIDRVYKHTSIVY